MSAPRRRRNQPVAPSPEVPNPLAAFEAIIRLDAFEAEAAGLHRPQQAGALIRLAHEIAAAEIGREKAGGWLVKAAQAQAGTR